MFDKNKNERQASKAPLPTIAKQRSVIGPGELSKKKDAVLAKIKAFQAELLTTEKKGEPTEKLRLKIRSLRAWEARFSNMLKSVA